MLINIQMAMDSECENTSNDLQHFFVFCNVIVINNLPSSWGRESSITGMRFWIPIYLATTSIMQCHQKTHSNANTKSTFTTLHTESVEILVNHNCHISSSTKR